jgi:hypothetical protein
VQKNDHTLHNANPENTAFQCFPEWAKHMVTDVSCMGHDPTPSSDLDSVGHRGTGAVVQHDNTPLQHSMMLYLDGSTKALKGSTVVLCVDGDI